jgi:putative membrane protein insertion efficiency factor
VAPPARPSWAARLLLAAVRVYQLTLSPVLGGSCRYVPSCSHYMADAVRLHGALGGGWLGLRRLSRCHPFGASGFDPVPEQRTSLSPSPGWPGGRLR